MLVPESNNLLLLKISSGLGITDQLWYVNRDQVARMRPQDWKVTCMYECVRLYVCLRVRA